MSDTLIKKGAAANFIWGIPSGLVSTTGRITNVELDRSVEDVTLDDENGETDGAIFLNPQSSGSFDCIMPTGGIEIPTMASTITIDGLTLYITGAKKRWENKGWAKYTCSFKGWDKITA